MEPSRASTTPRLTDADRAKRAFGKFLFDVASLLTIATVRKLGTVLNYSPAELDEVERDSSPGYVFVKSLRQKGIINPTDISTLLETLEDVGLKGIANEVSDSFKRNISDVCLQSDTGVPFRLQEKFTNFIKELKATYYYMCNRIQPNPYLRNQLQCVNNVFIDSGIEYLKNEGGSVGGTWEKLDSYWSLFQNFCPQNAKMFLLYGEPGYGKSTLALQYVYDWCNPCSDSPLKDILMLVYLPLRLVKGFASICMAIKKILFPRDFPLTEQEIFDIIVNCTSVLFVLDGFDEYSYSGDENKDDVSAIVSRKMFRTKHVLVTTRPPFDHKDLSHETKTFRLIGFDNKARREYILKAVADECTASVDRILHLLQDKPVLADICQVPLFFVMFVHMTHIKEMSQVLNSVTRFVCYIVSCFYEHAKIRKDAESIIQKDQRALHRIAFESLERKQQILIWEQEKFAELIGDTLYNELVDIGILVEENTLRIADAPGITADNHVQRKTMVRFFHKIFCEWYAAHYVAEYIKNAENTRTSIQSLVYRIESAFGITEDRIMNRLLEDVDPLHLQYMLRFACGLSLATGDRIIKYFRTIEGGASFALLCLLEQIGDIEGIKDTIRQMCSEPVIISGHDSLLLQRSSILLLNIAAKNDIPIACVCFYNCLQSVDLSYGTIKTTSGLVFSSEVPVKKLVICHYNRKTTEDEYYKVLKFSLQLSSLRYLWFDGSAPPHNIPLRDVLSFLQDQNVTVKYMGLFQSSPKYVLNLDTGRWEREDNGLECTSTGFDQMHFDWGIMGRYSERNYKRAVGSIRHFLRRRAVDEKRQEEEEIAASLDHDSVIG